MQNCTSVSSGLTISVKAVILWSSIILATLHRTADSHISSIRFQPLLCRAGLHATDMQDRLKRLVPSMKRSMQTVPSHSQLSTNILASAESDMPEAFLPQAHRCRFPWQAKTLEFIRACFGMLMVRLIAEP